MSLINDFKLEYRIGDMTTKLIFWNILLFAIPSVAFALLRLFNVEFNYYNLVGLPSNFSSFLIKPWTIVSYSFFHSGFMHILFNMIMLNFCGKLFVTFFTQKQLFALYVLGGLFGGVLFLLSYFVFPLLQNQSTLLVGASASVMAILVATTTYSPYMNIRLLLIGNVKLWHIAIVFLVLDLIQLPLENTGGHLAHIGGAVFGFVFIKALQAGTDLTSGFNSLLDFFANLFSPKKSAPFKKIHKNPKSSNPTKTTSRVVIKDKTQQQIDEILDKISQSGYDSLTKEEKDFLFRAGK